MFDEAFPEDNNKAGNTEMDLGSVPIGGTFQAKFRHMDCPL